MKLGDKITFVPFINQGEKGEKRRTYIGTVIFINPKHRVCTLEYEMHGKKFRESFKIINKSLEDQKNEVCKHCARPRNWWKDLDADDRDTKPKRRSR